MRAKLDLFTHLLLEWGGVHNLSGAKNHQDIEHNIQDSLQVLDFIEPFKSCLDVGSGAGFPAIPLSLACPNARFILLEPNAKKVAFLHHVKVALNLDNLEIQRMRIEHVSPQSVLVDLITSRALMNAQNLITLSAPFLREQGHFLFYKGSHLHAEIACADHECHVYGKRVYFYSQRRDFA
ncbi:rRNA small subunit methyltransferase, glucose inhibited division protein GidB [Helicobacter bizzozeronii CIII-1]|uniref:Ribosomal RNA small subunit methyltransferase G n=1 Tax=Helicobacter bizzozeronii (strain CIII-1) TaxID=1002804 RepID=F8KT75_HELBC|nr:16S rRNA (guanine(527)-N(7))-methyltransferase RsmG [Helicobacter bizzozeronii]CCB80026.1 rRNA small subunit methyltransferase, glucose inhibited division protein GidB [Helicobacter bizzozeronii CIII-1]